MRLKKKLPVIIMLIVLGMIALVGCGKKEEDYRQIQVYKIDGTAKVARQGSSMDAYENMQLQSGDIIETIADSYLQLKLDEDKYILVEPDSKISLQATGNSVDSKTSIYLEKGAVVNQLDNPLSKDSSYEVTTPNSTMAVRGTTFRVEITYDEKGESHAKVAVYGGKVECNLVFPDGTITEPVMVEAGTEVLVWGDDVESDYVWSGKTDYEELKLKVIDFLGVIIDRGEELSITKEEIEVLKEAKELLEQEENNAAETDEQEEGEEIEEKTENEDETKEEKKEEENPIKAPEQSESETFNQSTEQKEETEQNKPENLPQDNTDTDNTNDESYDDGSTGEESSDGSTGGESSGGNTNGGSNDGSTSGSNTGTNTPKTIKVEFYVGDSLFAYGTKTADSANKISVSCPTLIPTSAGSWQIEAEGDYKNLEPGTTMDDIDVSNMELVKFTWIDTSAN